MKLSIPALLAVAALASLPLQADPFIDNATSGLSLPGPSITFAEHVFASGTLITNQYADLGVTFAPGVYYDPQPGFFPGRSVGNFNLDTSDLISPFTIDFNVAQYGAAFQFITNPAPPDTLFQAYMGNTLVEQFTSSTNLSSPVPPNGFWYGFQGGPEFDSIVITPGGPGGAMLMSNIEMAPVPEPSTTIPLVAFAGVAAVAALRRKRANSTI